MRNNKIWGMGGTALAALAWCLTGLGPQARGQDADAFAAREEQLRTAPIITVSKEESTGRTNSWRVYLNDGQKAFRAIFKYVHRPRPKPLPSSYQYELAAYGLNKLYGLALVPPTIEREVDGRKGSLQCFCEGVMSEAARRRKGIEPPPAMNFQDALAEVGLFENLTNNPRDDASDILINTGDWKVWRVDFSEAFAPDRDLLVSSPFHRCSRRLYARLLEVSDETLRSAVQPYLNDEEIEALLARKKLIVDWLGALIRDKGEAAVLF